VTSQPAIEVRGLSKEYVIGRSQGGYKTLRESIRDAVLRPFTAPEHPATEIVWALKDVSFDVDPGEVVGIVGRNGAGKSTLLKILSRITEPTSGRAITRGRVAPLLEVGTGFHPELTGRENVHLNAAILGMSRAEIRRKFDAIVDFSGVERFIDTPVKRYSSGMYVRLAFAVAAYLESEILLVDEVLAVGDVAFQKKSLGKMKDVAREGRTVLFVSHNLGAVGNLCSSAILLRDGCFVEKSAVADVLSKYTADVGTAKGSAKTRDAALQILSVRVSGGQNGVFGAFDPCTVHAVFETRDRIEPAEINLTIQDADARTCIHLRSDFDGFCPELEPGRHEVEIAIESLNLEGQLYFLSVSVVRRNPLISAASEPIALDVRTGWDRHPNEKPITAVKRRWNVRGWPES
jgi:lipopolysaccharide transport system ATP-binding protein